MNLELIGIAAGLVVGALSTGLIAAYLRITRTSRGARNKCAIHLGQLLVGVLAIGSLLILTRLKDQIGIVPRSPASYASLYAFIASSVGVIFFAIRAEIRWRKTAGLNKTSLSDNTDRRTHLTPAGRRKFVSALALGLVSCGFAIAFLAKWPRPSSLLLGAGSWLCWFGVFVLLTPLQGRAYAIQLQKFVWVAFGIVEVFVLALYWKFHDSASEFSSAALIAALLLCPGVTIALVIMRRIMPRS